MTKLIAVLFLLFLSACNFHEVEAGKLYRSAQLSGGQFESAIKEFGIKTVINLRGANPDEKWFQEEVAVMEKFGINHINLKMWSNRIPHRSELIKLMDALKDAPRPILVHCQGGADRTGEAVAIYQMIVNGKSKEEAIKELSPQYNHIEQLKPAKKYFIRELWQGEDWAYNDYEPCTGEYKYYQIDDEFCKAQPE